MASPSPENSLNRLCLADRQQKGILKILPPNRPLAMESIVLCKMHSACQSRNRPRLFSASSALFLVSLAPPPKAVGCFEVHGGRSRTQRQKRNKIIFKIVHLTVEHANVNPIPPGPVGMGNDSCVWLCKFCPGEQSFHWLLSQL